MANTLLVDLADHPGLAVSLSAALAVPLAEVEQRSFPDGESYLRYLTPLDGRDVVLLCSLDRPDVKIAPLLFAAGAAREQGARSVGLVAPYLAYMRQDKQFNTGEAVTSVHFAALLSAWVDWMVTVDPHLHRRHSLSEIYTVPATVVHAAPLLAAWIGANIEKPFLIGPDNESRQWVASVASRAHCPFTVLEKMRHGDRDVSVSVPQLAQWRDRTPVLVDDIISSGHTMQEALAHLRGTGSVAPACVAVHGLFAEDAFTRLQQAGATRIVTTNSVAHQSNAMDLAPMLADAMREHVG
ncbi:MAG: ribose-phosphate pyrophosphokinase [Alphaproteobacteria bacterium]